MTAATASGTAKAGAGGGIEGGEKTQGAEEAMTIDTAMLSFPSIVGDLASPGKKRRIGQSRSLGSLQVATSVTVKLLLFNFLTLLSDAQEQRAADAWISPSCNKQTVSRTTSDFTAKRCLCKHLDLLHDALSSSVVRFNPSTSLPLQGMSSLIHPDEPSVTLVSSMMALLPN